MIHAIAHSFVKRAVHHDSWQICNIIFVKKTFIKNYSIIVTAYNNYFFNWFQKHDLIYV